MERPVPDTRLRRRWAPVWWLLPLLLLTTAGLAFLTWYLLMTHGMAYGALKAFWSDAAIETPLFDRYATALVVGVVANLVVGPASLWLAEDTRARRWPAAVVGVSCAVVAALVSGSALLLVLGLSPVDVLLAL